MCMCCFVLCEHVYSIELCVGDGNVVFVFRMLVFPQIA